MTRAGDALQGERSSFALPGGAHDRLIRLLAKFLPAGIGVVAAIMILAPLSPRGEVSFLLDRRKVAMTSARIDVDKAMYRGTDNAGRLFEVTAGKAVQPTPAQPVVDLQKLAAQLQLAEGPAQITAPSGAYNFQTEKVTSREPLQFAAPDGYRMTMRNVEIDMKTRSAVGAGGVSGQGQAGEFTSDRILADLGARTIALDGNARLRMVPGQKLRIPQ